MPSLLDEMVTYRPTSPAERLRITMAAVRVAFTWFGVRKSLSAVQKAEAAATFDAEGNFFSAGKKLLDTSHPAFKAVTTVRGRMISFWKGISLPFPDPGVRLIRQDDISMFDVHFTTLKAELAEAVAKLDEQYSELKQTARNRLGRLFNPADYPTSLRALFDVSWDFPSVEPPDYLRQLSPHLYEQERARIAARFDEAVKLAEEAFTGELAKLVSHLTERLTGQDDGKPKVFRDSAIDNLREFFDRFRTLSVRSDDQLDDLVVQAQRAISGVKPQELRDNTSLRQHVATQLSAVGATLDGLMVDRPRAQLATAPQRGGLMDLVISPAGIVSCVYDEVIDVAVLGKLTIRRASHVEPDSQGRWLCDLAPVSGPSLGPFDCRSQALQAERAWLDLHLLDGRR